MNLPTQKAIYPYHKFSTIIVPVGFFLFIFIIFSIFIPSYFTLDNITNIFSQGASFGFSSLAFSLIIISGNMDLSIGSIVSFSCTLTALLMAQENVPVFLACLIVTFSGTLLGLSNGLLVQFTNLNSLIITYLSQAVFSSLGFLLCNGQPITGLPLSFSFIGRGSILGIPVNFSFLLVFLICTNYILNKSYYGKYIFAIGGNRVASRLAGINLNRTRNLVFSISGFFSSLCGIILCSRINYGLPTAGDDYTFNSLAITILSGIPLTGGYGSILNIIFGVLTYSAINTGLILMGLNLYVQKLIVGIVVFIAALLNAGFIKKFQFKNLFSQLGDIDG